MRGQTIVFDGHRINDLFYVGEVAVGLPEFRVEYDDSLIGDGSRFLGKHLGTVQIDMQLVSKPVWGAAPRESLSALMSWLDVDEPKVLALSSDRGLWRLCVPIGTPQVLDNEWDDRIAISFLQLDPILYGSRREVTVPSGSSVAFHVGGDYPTMPTISASAAVRDSTTLQWGVRLDNADVMRVTVPVETASTVAIDCGKRTCSVNGATTIPTLASDWFELKPGAHTLQNDQGTGACVVSWHERWHR